MSIELDTRPGRDLGLTEEFADVPAFQIVNDAHDRLVHIAGLVTDLEHGAAGERVRADPEFERITRADIAFHHRFEALAGDAVQAAQLSRDIRAFRLDVLEPFAARHAGGSDG